MLKVGDIVKIREDLSYDMDKTDVSITIEMLKLKGQTATVTEVDTDNTVKLGIAGGEFWWHKDWVEKLNKFKEGDKVHIVRSGEGLTDCAGGWNPSMKEYIGDVVTIERSYDYKNETTGYIVKENVYTWDVRLLEPVTKYFTGKVVCINDNDRCDITKGRIYNFINGEALDDNEYEFPWNGCMHSVDELNDYYKKRFKNAPQFIEIVE